MKADILTALYVSPTRINLVYSTACTTAITTFCPIFTALPPSISNCCIKLTGLEHIHKQQKYNFSFTRETSHLYEVHLDSPKASCFKSWEREIFTHNVTCTCQSESHEAHLPSPVCPLQMSQELFCCALTIKPLIL